MHHFSTLLANNKKSFILALILGVFFSAISIVVPIISGDLISSVVNQSSERGILLAAFLALNLLRIVFAQLDEYTGKLFRIKQKKTMRGIAFHSFLQNHSTREETSGFVSFVNNDIPTITEQYFYGTIDIIKCLSLLILSSVSIFFIHWSFALIIFSVSFLMVIFPNLFRRKGETERINYSGELAHYNNIFRSFLDGSNILKIHQAFNYSRGVAESANEQVKKSETKLAGTQVLVRGSATVLQVTKTVLIIIVGVFLIAKKEIPIGSIVTIVQLSEIIGAPIEVLAYLRHARHEALPLLKRYEELICKSDRGVDENGTAAEVFQRLVVDKVSYRVDEVSILDEVSVCFNAGEKYLIIGESGSGKSTLLRLLARIGDSSYTGTILYNHQDIRSITYESYYQTLCQVFQEPYLFCASLKENIYLGRKIPHETYLNILEKLNLTYLLDRYHDQDLTPEIIETLSGGERQRVALARAMVGSPSVFLLDEVTSALDCINAENIERILLNYPGMVIHVCHNPNLNLISHYDKVFRMEKGRLSEVH